MRLPPIIGLCLLVLHANQLCAGAASQDIVQSVSSAFEDVLSTAAKATIKAITRQTGQERLLERVPLDSLKVFIGRQHHVAVELDGQEYEVTLGAEEDASRSWQELPQLPPRETAGGNSRRGGSNELVSQDWWSQREHKLALPEVTLTGPLELVLSEAQPVSVFLPHSADVGLVRRVLLAAGATARVSHMTSISLRRPVDLPRLPGQYLAEVYASVKLGEPERGFHLAPGIMFMSNKLREMAVNQTGGTLPLLSFEVEPAAFGALSITAEGQAAGDVAPRLKVKRAMDGTIELSVRPGQVVQPSLEMQSLTHMWAWPLPHLHTSSWLPYESMLRGILASHAFDIGKVAKHGLPLKLTKSTIKGVSMMAFEMHLRRRDELEVPEGYPFPNEETPLEIWEVVVQVHEKTPSSSKQPQASRFKYVPMNARRKAVFGNTFAVDEEDLVVMQNSSLPLGFESEDLGVARYAP